MNNLSRKEKHFENVKSVVYDFYLAKRRDPDFYVEDLLEYVQGKYGPFVSLQTPYRRLCELRSEGKVHYDVKNSLFTFHYLKKSNV